LILKSSASRDGATTQREPELQKILFKLKPKKAFALMLAFRYVRRLEAPTFGAALRDSGLSNKESRSTVSKRIKRLRVIYRLSIPLPAP
jgi:hypothetical protein